VGNKSHPPILSLDEPLAEGEESGVQPVAQLLEQRYTQRLQPFDRVVMLQRPMSMMNLDHRAAFFLSRIDGSLTIDELLDIAAIPRVEAMRLLCDWLDEGYVIIP
jgi:hypothetical protein